MYFAVVQILAINRKGGSGEVASIGKNQATSLQSWPSTHFIDLLNWLNPSFNLTVRELPLFNRQNEKRHEFDEHCTHK